MPLQLSRLALVAALLAFSAAARADVASCAAPARIGDGWEAAAPAEAGFDTAALCATLNGVAEGSANIHSVLVERHGRLVAELYRHGSDRSVYSPFARTIAFGPTVAHDMRSISKTMVGLLVGIAQGEGKLPALSTPVLDLYPELSGLKDPQRSAITLEQLLTMSSGLKWDERVSTYGSLSNDETRLFWDWNPVRFILRQPVVSPPGKEFNYSGGATALLADIIVRATGKSLRIQAQDGLFGPLGITDWEWIGDIYGRPLAFAGLRLRPRDLMKVGRMMLDHGQWQGRQIVPAAWIEAMLRPRIVTDTAGMSYGYQIWAGTLDRQGRKLAFDAAVGNGGQRLFLVPELDMAVVVTSGAYNDPVFGRVLNPLFRQIVAAVKD
jgi:CubicO group peptidase (beta-lactamase class C family)